MSTGFCKFAFFGFDATFGCGLFIFWGIYGANPWACRRRISPAPGTACRSAQAAPYSRTYEKSWVNYAFTLDK